MSCYIINIAMLVIGANVGFLVAAFLASGANTNQ